MTTRQSLSETLVQTRVQSLTRRHFLGRASCSFGATALAGLLNGPQALAALANATSGNGSGRPHPTATAKRVIYLHMAGSPPQHDLLDPKPLLNQRHGELAPVDCYNDRSAFVKPNATVCGSPFRFDPVGDNGARISELLPHFKTVVDDVCIVRSMYTEQFNHAPAQLLLYTGHPLQGRPSMGSWLSWGLGSENRNLPDFLVLVSGGKKPSAGTSVWGSGFLPTIHSGVQCRNSGDPVLDVKDPAGMDRTLRRRTIDAINAINQLHVDEFGDAQTLARIEQYELAYRMQTEVPDVMDISKEDPEVLEAYGADPGKASFANNCLLARRLSESGVRFVQLFDWGWDMHGTSKETDLIHGLPMKCQGMDRPVTALLRDLKQRGLLDETLVIWTGEFGRTVMNEERSKGTTLLGRDHYPGCYSIWMAGGGSNAGGVIGATDEWGAHVAENPIHVHDLQATMLHMLGIDHERLTFRSQGRDFRLTDVHGTVRPELLA